MMQIRNFFTSVLASCFNRMHMPTCIYSSCWYYPLGVNDIEACIPIHMEPLWVQLEIKKLFGRCSEDVYIFNVQRPIAGTANHACAHYWRLFGLYHVRLLWPGRAYASQPAMDADDVNEVHSQPSVVYTVLAITGVAWYCIITSLGLLGCISAYVMTSYTIYVLSSL